MRQFMIAFEGLDLEKEIRLRDLLGESGYKFWHRFPGTWIVMAPDDVTAFNLRNSIFTVFGIGNNFIVAEFKVQDLATVLRTSISEWFEKHLDLHFRAVDKVPEKSQKNATQK
jgi:hypothetical protein